MVISTIKEVIGRDIHKVWETVLAVENYSQWRSDISKTKVINKKQFIEYTKDGFATTFTVTAAEQYKRWEFDMENTNMRGHWTGVFRSRGDNTEIQFTEVVTAKKWMLKPFVKGYLKNSRRDLWQT